MKNYINADLYRIFTRVNRWIMMALVFVVMIIIFGPSSSDTGTIVDRIDVLEQVLKYAPVYLGFIEIIYLFGDDFIGKTAQIAIGIGISREKVIFAKWVEALIVIAIDVASISVLAIVLSVIQTHSLPVQLVGDVLVHMLITVLAAGAYVALVFPIMFSMQNITVAFLMYILLSSGAINKIVGLIGTIKTLKKIGIERFTLTNLLTVFRSRLILGSFRLESILGIIIYLGVALWITSLLYKKKELEF